MIEAPTVEDPTQLLELALTGQPERALAALEPRVGADEPDPRLWRAYGIALGMCGRLEPGRRALEQALARAPGDVWSRAYLGVFLQALGDAAAADVVFDGLRPVYDGPLLPDAGAKERDALHSALLRHVLEHPTLTWNAPFKATTHGWQTDDLLRDAAPCVRQLRLHLERIVSGLLQAWADEDDEPAPADSLSLAAWGVVMRHEGAQKPHVHPAAVLSGVYYLAVPPPRGDAGSLRFRKTLPWIRCRPGTPPDVPRIVHPEVGKLIVFPSHLWHDTVPCAGPDRRVSIAFDVLPARP